MNDEFKWRCPKATAKKELKQRFPKGCKRYQECRWYEKLWRRRHYLRIPLNAISIWWKSNEKFKHAWSIAHGMADFMMGWYYTQEEVREMEHDRRKPPLRGN